ncbi:MAG: MFS transporter [Proteiniphilum sp.]|nr:MFS transporter [Proteiniphilum sp.]
MKNKTIAFIANFTGIFLFGISMVIIGSILPVLKSRFGMTDIEAGGLFTILPIGLLIGSVLFGPIVDKFGYRGVLSVASLFLAIGFLGIAHAPSIFLLTVCIFFFGIGGGTINGATSALVSDLSEGKAKIINLNWLGMFYGVGAFSMPLVLSLISDNKLVVVLNVAAILSLLSGVIFLLIKYPLTVDKEKITLKVIPTFVKNKLFMTITFYLFFQSAFEAIVNNWSVSYFIDTLGIEQGKALVALSYSVLGLIVMRLLIGSVLKNLNHNKLIFLSLLLFVLGSAGLLMNGYLFNSIGMFVLGAGLAPGFPVMLGIVGEMFKEVSGTAFSFAMFIALIGNTIINYTTGLLTNYYGMQAYIFVVLGVISFMILIYAVIRRLEKLNK